MASSPSSTSRSGASPTAVWWASRRCSGGGTDRQAELQRPEFGLGSQVLIYPERSDPAVASLGLVSREGEQPLYR